MNTEADKKILLLFIRYQINENPKDQVSTKDTNNGNPALINQEEDT